MTYELSADSSVNAVETRLYAWNKNAGYPQFKDGKFTDPETKREFQLKTDKDGLVYVEYILKKGESFTEEFEFIDTTLEVGTQITFDVAIGANGVVPANCFESTAKKYGIDFALKKDATESPPRYLVFFKGRDADVLTAAFKEFSAKKLTQEKKPSIRKLLSTLKEAAQGKNAERAKVKNKDREVSL